MIKNVIKRDGRKKEYNGEFIKQAIKNAFSNTQDTKDIISELRFNNIQTLAKSNE